MGFHQYFLCKSRYLRLLSPYAAPAWCGKHFRFKALKVNHLINAAIPMLSFFSLFDKPVVLKRLIQMILKCFLCTQTWASCYGCTLEVVVLQPFSKVPLGNEGASLGPCPSNPGGFCEMIPLPSAVGSKLFSSPTVHPLPGVIQRDQDHVKYSRTEQQASFCVFKTTSSVMTDNCSLATKSVTGIGNPPGWYLALKS